MQQHQQDGSRVYDLNISENYVPNWGAWEVGREVISNAIDADKLGYKVETPTKDQLRVSTRTKPTLAQIKFIGGGTKNNTTGTIGCFGEGIKLAAMVAARLGGNMRIRFDQYEVSYELKHDEDLGGRSALMFVKDAPDFFDGMIVDIELEDIARAVSGKFLPASTGMGMIEKVDPEKMIIYNKGVFVAEKPAKSIYDWNLNSSINRDRNVVDFWDIGNAIAALIETKINVAMAQLLMDAPADTFEVEIVKKHHYQLGHRAAQAFLDAVKAQHGPNVVMATDDAEANKLARRTGRTVILIDDAFRQIIQKISPEDRIPTSEEILTHRDRLEINYDKQYDMKDIDRLIEILETPVEVYVFEGGNAKEYGVAEFKEGKRRVYLNSILFEPGYRSQKLATLIHEIAHVNSKASDGEFSFENELGRLAGKLAKLLIEG